MPNWKTHLEIGKRLNEKIKYNEEKFNLFLLGNILPDINNCYIVNDISQNLRHDYTHFQNVDNPTYISFYEEYKNELKINPIVLGYYSHLYTDYNWNHNFYTRFKNETKLSNVLQEQLRILKQKDFEVYNDKYLSNKLNISDFKSAAKETEIIDRVKINEKDIQAVVEFINTQKSSKGNLKYYTINELDELMNETVEKIWNEINEK